MVDPEMPLNNRKEQIARLHERMMDFARNLAMDYWSAPVGKIEFTDGSTASTEPLSP